MTSVTLASIEKAFRKGGEITPVLSSFSLSVNEGEFVCIVGPNGSGKSTILNLIAGLLAPDKGKILISDGRPGRARIGYAWQDYRSSLLPWRTAAENLAFPLEVVGVPRQKRLDAAESLLRNYASDIPPGRAIYRLSGGQQQLISALRSFISDPDVVLMDEPFSALDQYRRWEVGRHVEAVWLKRKPPTLFVSHDIDEAILMSDRIVLLGNAGSGYQNELTNSLPRPRTVEMLTEPSHIRLRNSVLEHMSKFGAE